MAHWCDTGQKVNAQHLLNANHIRHTYVTLKKIVYMLFENSSQFEV